MLRRFWEFEIKYLEKNIIINERINTYCLKIMAILMSSEAITKKKMLLSLLLEKKKAIAQLHSCQQNIVKLLYVTLVIQKMG